MSSSNKNLFLAWVPFQRRAQTLAKEFDLDTHYYHYHWEERGKIFKAISYAGKFLATLGDLFRYRPEFVFIQLAPAPLLYAAAFYCAVTRNHYISDCHNTMIYDGPYIKWPLARFLLRRSFILLVHNEDVQAHTKRLHLPSRILRDPLPIMVVPGDIVEVAGIRLKETTYVLVPCSMARDEPVRELFDAARALPDVFFVMTWFADRLAADLRAQAPDNVRFTGFLPEPEFNALYANADAALVLTTREGTQPSGAAEAISLGVPLVVSDIQTTRRLYKDRPVYVRNEPDFIAEGIRTALADHDELARRAAALRDELVTEASSQIDAVKQLMSA